MEVESLVVTLAPDLSYGIPNNIVTGTPIHHNTPANEYRRVAIVGMAVHYAGADSPSALWDSLIENRVATGEISAARLGTQHKDQHWMPRGANSSCGFVDDRYGVLDTASSPANEHDWLLQLAKEACSDANLESTHMKRIGVAGNTL